MALESKRRFGALGLDVLFSKERIFSIPIIAMCLERLLELEAFICVYMGENRCWLKKKSERGLEKSSVICFNDLLILLYWYSRGCCCQWHLHLWTYGIYDHEIRTFIHPLKLLVDSVPLLPAWNRRILLSESICKTLLLFSSKYKYTRANCQG